MKEQIYEAREDALLKILEDYIKGKEISKEETDRQKMIIEVAKVIADDDKRLDAVDRANDELEIEKEKIEIEREKLSIERTDREFRRGIDDDRLNNEHDVEMAKIDIENSKLDIEREHKRIDLKAEQWKLIFSIGTILLKAGLIAIDRNAIMSFEQNGILRSAAWKHILAPKNL